MPTAFPSIPVSQSSSRMTSNDISTIKFGNGYAQRTPNGINYQRDKWTVIWGALTLAQKNTIVTFIQALSAGDYTTWTTPFDSVQKKFVLEGDWSIKDAGGNIFSIQINLTQVYDI